MPFWRTYYHLVWTTKNREPLIQPEIEKRLYAYLVRKAAELGVYVYAIDGWTDHVHLIVSIPPKHAVAEVVHRLKGASSHDMGVQSVPFEWQRGYGVLTVGEKHRAMAQAYVAGQKTHHAEGSAIPALEYCAEGDEGPADVGLKIDAVPAILREEGAPYAWIGDWPF